MLLYRTSSACLNDLLVDESSSLLRLLLGCYGSAFYGEIFNALGTDIVTACFYLVKGIFKEGHFSSLVIGFSKICLLGEITCRVMGNEG